MQLVYNTGKGDCMFRKWYSVRGFSKLIKTQAYPDITYVVNGYVYVGGGLVFKRMNKETLSYERINEFQDFAKENNKPCMVVFVGENHILKMLELMKGTERMSRNVY